MSEHISALMDDEIAVDEAAHLFAMLQSNKQAAEAWRQYHFIGDAMRGEVMYGEVALSTDFKSNLMQKIDLEPTVLAPNAAQPAPHVAARFKEKLPAKWAIAASVAAVTLVGWMALNQQTASNQNAPAVEIAQADVVEQNIPAEYLMAHQASAPSASSYYIQSASYAEQR